MKKSDIIALVTILVIFAGIFSNGMALRNKFFKGEFDDPYKNGVKENLANVTSVLFSEDTTAYWKGRTDIIQNDTLSQIMSTLKEPFYEIDGTCLKTWQYKNETTTRILLPKLENIDAKRCQKVNIEGFQLKELRISSENYAAVVLKDCRIENLIVDGNKKGTVTIDSTNVIQNLELKLRGASTFASHNIVYSQFSYDIDDDCNLNLSGRSLDVLKQENTESDE